MDTDDYFWLPSEPNDTVKRPAGERIELMERDIRSSENVVISGSLTDWGDVLIPHFTLAVRIEMDPALRIERLIKREIQRYGSRVAPDGDMYQHHLEFIEWAKAYDTGGRTMRSKAKHDEWQKLLPCKVLCLDGADTLQHNFSQVLKALQTSGSPDSIVRQNPSIRFKNAKNVRFPRTFFHLYIAYASASSFIMSASVTLSR